VTSFSLEYLGQISPSRAAPGLAPGERVSIDERSLWIIKRDARGVPARFSSPADRVLQLDDDAVSWGGHCRIWVEQGKCFIQDLGSNNGTWLESSQADQAPRKARGPIESEPIEPGQLVVIGRCRFRLLASHGVLGSAAD
jgi:hypothetical protein